MFPDLAPAALCLLSLALCLSASFEQLSPSIPDRGMSLPSPVSLAVVFSLYPALHQFLLFSLELNQKIKIRHLLLTLRVLDNLMGKNIRIYGVDDPDKLTLMEESRLELTSRRFGL